MRLTPFFTYKVGGWPLVKCPLSPVRVLVVTLEANWRAVCCTVNLLYLFIDPFIGIYRSTLGGRGPAPLFFQPRIDPPSRSEKESAMAMVELPNRWRPPSQISN
jgi:hypothetical protein